MIISKCPNCNSEGELDPEYFMNTPPYRMPQEGDYLSCDDCLGTYKIVQDGAIPAARMEAFEWYQNLIAKTN